MGYTKNSLITTIALTLLLFFCASINSSAQSDATTADNTLTEEKEVTRYQIQLAAYKNPQLIKLDNFKNVGHSITIEKNDKDIHRVLVKGLHNEVAAKKALAIIQAKGYADAFYTTYQSEIEVETAGVEEMSDKPEEMTVETDTNTNPPKKEVSSIEGPIEPIVIEEQKDEVFLVELGSFESVNLLHNTAEIRSMGELFRQKVKGGEKIYIGVFDDLSLAELTLQKVKAQGYNTASLRKVERSKVVSSNGNAEPIQNVADRKKNIKDLRRKNNVTMAATADVVNQSFEKMNFNIFKVDAYDPTNKSSFMNDMLKGTELPAAILAFFDKGADKNLQYFSIGSFNVTPNHIAYMVRSGTGNFHTNNDIHLYIYNQTSKKMIGKELISSVMTTSNTYSKIQTWITDANKDGILDLLIYKKSETTTPDGQYASTNNLVGKVWLNNAYVKADIKDAENLKKKLGVN